MQPRQRASIVVVKKDHLLCVRLADPSTGRVATYVPGGKVELAETPAQAAERECLEESGYRVIAETSSEIIANYPFTFDGTAYDCTTHFFRGRLVDPEEEPATVNDATYHRGVLWIPLSEINAQFGFHEKIRQCVQALATTGACSKP